MSIVIEHDKVIVLDVETNILNDTGIGFKASPFFKGNNIVCLGFIDADDETETPVVMDARRLPYNPVKIFNAGMWVGHNIKFDILHIRKQWPRLYEEWYKAGGRVWDTMVVEYLLSGQTEKSPSLDSCAVKYGGTVKDDKIKEYWDKGIDTALIPQSELHEYLEGDVRNTLLIFNKQLERVSSSGMYPLVTAQMEATLALAEMEWNGMQMDRELLAGELVKKEIKVASLLISLRDRMLDILPENLDVKALTPLSPNQVATMIYGGEVKTKEYVPVLDGSGNKVLYKSGIKKGEVRTKVKNGVVRIKPGVVMERLPSKITNNKLKSGNYPVDDSALRALLELPPTCFSNKGLPRFIEDLLAYRELEKDVGTYYHGYLKELWDDDRIHANFNQAITATGRLSCSSPNLQNLSKKDVDND